MRSALLGVDIVRIGVYDFIIAVIKLEADFNLIFNIAFFIAIKLVKVNRVRKHSFAIFVEKINKLHNSALELENLFSLFALALVFQRNHKAFVEESNLSEAIFHGVITKNCGLENFVVRPECDCCSALVSLAHNLERRHSFSTRKFNDVIEAVLINLRHHFAGECVHAGNTHAVQAAGNFVALASELPARVQFGENNFHRAFALFLDYACWNATAVIGHTARAIFIDCNGNLSAIACKGLVDRVINNLRHQVMQPVLVSRADIHARPLSNRVEPLQHLNVACVILDRL